LLRTQYRCHPNISQVANYLFYENYLLDGVKAESRRRLLKMFNPITFISAEKGVESKSEFSYRNYYEAKFIMGLLNYIVNLVMRLKSGIADSSESEEETKKDEGNPDYSIGVILTYRSQVGLI
jgi:superfamily I DNA and/or RNA helicase